MDYSELEAQTSFLAGMGSLIGLITYNLFFIISQKFILNKIKNKLEKNEKIILLPKASPLITIIFPIMTCGFIGGFIVPFFIYNNINQIKLVNKSNFLIWVIISIILLITMILIPLRRIVLTNYRIIYECFMLDKYKKNLIQNIYYKDINSVEWTNESSSKNILFVNMKDNLTHNLYLTGDTLQIKKEIEKYLD